MLMDSKNMFSNEQSLVAAAGAILSERSIDLGAAQLDTLGNTPVDDIGRGIEIEVLCQVTETFDSAGDAVTCKAQLVMADDEALSTNLVVLQSTEAIAQAILVAGYQFRLGGSPPPGISKRYLGIRYTTAVADATAGKISAGLLKDRQSTSV